MIRLCQYDEARREYASGRLRWEHCKPEINSIRDWLFKTAEDKFEFIPDQYYVPEELEPFGNPWSVRVDEHSEENIYSHQQLKPLKHLEDINTGKLEEVLIQLFREKNPNVPQDEAYLLLMGDYQFYDTLGFYMNMSIQPLKIRNQGAPLK